MNLFENAVERSFYVHVSPSTNLDSIQSKGLVPNHNGGNYDQVRWESLDGVYASRYAKQLNDYLNAHLIVDFILVVIEVDMAQALPDEDTIDIIFDHLFEAMLNADGLRLRSPEIEDMYPGEKRFEAYVARLAEGFTKLAGETHTQIDPRLPHEAAEIWLSMKVGADDGEGEFVWGEIKDKLVHAYRTMAHPVLGTRHSVRIPSTVGFEGPTRIVGIIRVEDDAVPDVIYNKVPPEAREEVNALVHEIIDS